MFAAHQAGRVEFGTYDLSLPDIWSQVPSFVQERAKANAHPPQDLASYCRLFPKPEQIEALFMFVEGQRISARLAEAYRGLQKDLAWAASHTRILPPLIQSILPYLNATLKPGWEHDATVAGSLLMATELYASLPEYAAQLSRQRADEDAMGGAPDNMMQKASAPRAVRTRAGHPAADSFDSAPASKKEKDSPDSADLNPRDATGCAGR